MTDWPHAPAHYLTEAGAYMVTAATYRKARLLDTPDRLSLLRDNLFNLAQEYGWRLQAWAVLANHYHFVALSPADPRGLRRMLGRLHASTATEMNRLDATPGRKVWFQYWESRITFQRSYFARLNYVHQNPVRHGVVAVASAYPWCSAGWFESRGDGAFVKMVGSFGTGKLAIPDDFDG